MEAPYADLVHPHKQVPGIRVFFIVRPTRRSLYSALRRFLAPVNWKGTFSPTALATEVPIGKRKFPAGTFGRSPKAVEAYVFLIGISGRDRNERLASAAHEACHVAAYLGRRIRRVKLAAAAGCTGAEELRCCLVDRIVSYYAHAVDKETS